MKILTALIGLAGGLGLFIFGMNFCTEGLQKIAVRRLKQLVKVLTKNPLMGLISGAIITVGLQSSSATSALVIGFVNAELMSLAQALGVLLGSALGASLTAQLIAFKITNLALVLLFGGAFLYLFAKRSRQRSIGQSILGFGLLFYGMYVMASSMVPLREAPGIARTLIGLEKYPWLEFMVGLLVTAIFQSSPAFLALLMTLASQQLVGASAIIPFILGAHLGGTVTGVLSSLGTPGRDAKRAAAANFAFKLINGLVFLPFYKPLTQLILWSAPDVSRQIANAHTLFSLLMAVGFCFFSVPLSNLLKKMIPDQAVGLGEAVFLDTSQLDLPEIALDQAHRQTLEMGKLVDEEMLARILPTINYGNETLIERINQVEEGIDSLYQKISRYVTSLGNNRLSDELMEKSIQILYVANDLEHIGDLMVGIGKNLSKIKNEELELSPEGLEELKQMYAQVYEHFKLALKAFETLDSKAALLIVKEYPKIQRLEKEMRYNHFDRMQCGNEKTKLTSAVHLDLVEALLRIDAHAVSIAQVVMGIV